MADVTFFFDPACPWTWRASRWLTLVADARGLDIEWRPMSLLVVNGGDLPEQYRKPVEASHRLLRVIEKLRQDGRQTDITALYRAIGERVHDHDTPLDEDIIVHVLGETGLADLRDTLDDESLDDAVEAFTTEAMAAAGPDVGSPVLVLPGAERGLHGPVLGAVPEKADSLALWDAVEALAPITDFYEIKRGRS
jgi:2-hydroxychromene-2-carboxylate isomerase